MTRLICIDGGDQCEPHALGEAIDKCPGLCDVPGCRDPLAADSERSEDSYCAAHLAMDQGGASVEEMAAATNKASLYGVSLARLVREALTMVPLQPEIDRQR